MLAAVLTLLLSTNPYLAESRQLYESLRYEKAITRLELARKVSTMTNEERREILDLLAKSYAALGQLKEAEDAYAELLSKDPHAPSPEDAAPKIRQVFQRAKERLYPQTYVRVRAEAAPEGEVAVEVIDPWDQITSVVLFEEQQGSGYRDSLMSYDKRRASAPFSVREPPHRYFIEARAADGEARARLGTADRPIVIEAPAKPAEKSVAVVTPAVVVPKEIIIAPPPPPPAKPLPTWVPWTLAGLAASSAAVGTAFALAASKDSSAAGQADFADDTARLDVRARERAVTANWLIGGSMVAGGVAAVLFVAW